MNPMQELAEQRIREAIERGDLDDLPGAGRPLELEEDSAVPEELRMAYRILKRADCLPPEIEERKEIRSLEDLLATHGERLPQTEHRAARRRLDVLRQRLASRRGAGPLWAEPGYREALLARLDRDEGDG